MNNRIGARAAARVVCRQAGSGEPGLVTIARGPASRCNGDGIISDIGGWLLLGLEWT